MMYDWRFRLYVYVIGMYIIKYFHIGIFVCVRYISIRILFLNIFLFRAVVLIGLCDFDL